MIKNNRVKIGHRYLIMLDPDNPESTVEAVAMERIPDRGIRFKIGHGTQVGVVLPGAQIVERVS